MSRRSDFCFAVRILERDPRVRTLPLGARMAWLLTTRAFHSVSTFRHGATVRELAFRLCVSPLDLEAHLRPLIDRGLLRCDADGTITSTLLRADSRPKVRTRRVRPFPALDAQRQQNRHAPMGAHQGE